MSKWNEYPLAALILRMMRGATLGAVLLMPMHVSAQEGYDPRDIAMLPNYCRHTQTFSRILGTDHAERERWYQRLGPTFHHMHHYCFGLIATFQASRAVNKHQRANRLRTSISEFNYVLARSPRDFPLLPEILTKKGESLIKLDQGHLGMLELQRAIAVKPDYWPPYAALSDYLRAAGDTAKAREWLEKGLAASPNIKALESRLAELGGAKGIKPAPKAPESPEKRKPAAEKPAADPAQEATEPQTSPGNAVTK